MRASIWAMTVLAAIVLLADALSSPPPVQTPSSQPGIPTPTRFPYPLRLRGGHRQSGFRKSSRVNKAIGQKNSKRIHAPIREHNVKRSRERLARRGILTGLEGMVEEKKKPDRKPLRKPRLFETTVHDYMSRVEAYKVLHPEVWEEERRDRMDKLAKSTIEGYLEDIEMPDIGDEEAYWNAEHDQTLILKRSQSHYRLGLCYDSGYGFDGKVDKAKAIYHIKEAAELGFPEAQSCMGYYHMMGDGVEMDEAKGLEFFRLAAASGECDALFNIGLCYLDGVQVEASPQTAFSWFNRSASEGQPDAMYSMAMCLQQGRGCMRDEKAAFRILVKLVDQYTYAAAELSLGECYLFGIGVGKDAGMGARLVATAAQVAMPQAQYLLGLCLMSGYGGEVDETKAMVWLKAASAAGHEDAQTALSKGVGADEAKSILDEVGEEMSSRGPEHSWRQGLHPSRAGGMEGGFSNLGEEGEDLPLDIDGE